MSRHERLISSLVQSSCRRPAQTPNSHSSAQIATSRINAAVSPRFSASQHTRSVSSTARTTTGASAPGGVVSASWRRRTAARTTASFVATACSSPRISDSSPSRYCCVIFTTAWLFSLVSPAGILPLRRELGVGHCPVSLGCAFRGRPRSRRFLAAALSRLLGPTERLDLLDLLWREAARDLAAGHLLRLNVAADVADDLGVGQGGRIPDVGEVGDPRDDPAHNLAGPR